MKVKKVRLLLIAASLIVVCSITLISILNFHSLTGQSQRTTPVQLTPKNPYFNLLYINYQGAFDTFQGMYTRDETHVETSLTLGEFNLIYNKMLEIDFFNYPDMFIVKPPPGENYYVRSPAPMYFIKVQYKTQIKTLSCDDFIIYHDEKADKLRELVNLIERIIDSKEEIKQLPKRPGLA
jgi:hypothetical protein